MANILISQFSPVIQDGRYTPICFFEGLAKGFSDEGNNVKTIISSCFLPRAWNGTNDIHADIDEDRLIADIKEFKPDLCVFGNNSVPECIYEITDCPVIILLSDTVTYINDRDTIKSSPYWERIHFYAPFPRDLDEITELYGKDAKILNLLPATGVVAEDIETKHNISFIGSNFQNDDRLKNLIKAFKDKNRLQEILKSVEANPSAINQILTTSEKDFINIFMPVLEFSFAFSARNRIMTLALLASEGLALYGSENWIETARYFPDLAASFNPKIVYSLQHNQDIYNASKVCFSVSHTQASDGFPWRIMDIMASNGCLLADKNRGLSKFIEGHVDIPLYESPLEAKDLAHKLLQDDVWRSELVQSSQKCIEEKGRWRHRFAEIEKILNVKLLNKAHGKGELSTLFGEDYLKAKWSFKKQDAAETVVSSEFIARGRLARLLHRLLALKRSVVALRSKIRVLLGR